jgi:hypothetical protein
MLCSLVTACAVLGLLAAPAPSDSAAVTVIRDEVNAFYRDLDARRWSPLLDHFLPAKVTARWAPPTDDSTWSTLAAPPPARESERCAPRTTVAVVGDWARVRARRCAAGVDELWLLRVSGRWKIVHLALANPIV